MSPRRSLLCANLPPVNDWGPVMLQRINEQARPLGTTGNPAGQELARTLPHAYPTSGGFGLRIATQSPSDLGRSYTVVADGKLVSGSTPTEGGSITGACFGAVDPKKPNDTPYIGKVEFYVMGYDQAADRTTAEIFVQPKTRQLDLVVSAVVRRLAIWPRGQELTPHGFSPEFVAASGFVGGFRFMQTFGTNSSKVTTDADRAKEGEPTYGESVLGVGTDGYRGLPDERAMILCRTTGQAAYLNVPWHADPDYQRAMATRMLTILRDRDDDVELSNEPWNTANDYQQGRDCQAEGEAWAKTRPDVREWLKSQNGGSDDANGWRWCYYAERVVQMSETMRSVGLTKARFVYGTQVTWLLGARIGLDYIAKFHGPVTNYVQALAGAPYCGKADRADRFASNKAVMKSLIDMANAYGLLPYCYEWGYEQLGDDEKVEDDLVEYLSNWFDLGGNRAYYYTLFGQADSPYTAEPDVLKPGSPRYRAIRRVAAKYLEAAPVPAPPPVSPLVAPAIDHIDAVAYAKDNTVIKTTRIFP
jgi:hypothetical protein